MRPDIEQLILTLRGGQGSHVPAMELGVHPKIKEHILGRPLSTVADEIAFSHMTGYDYVKLQPIADFNPGNVGMERDLVREYQDGTVTRTWASEGKGIIANLGDLERYRFPDASEFSYERFEGVRSLLPEGMGVIGQYGDIFTMTWEMMGFEEFSVALFENPELVQALNTRLGELVVSMFEHFAQDDAVDALWYSDDIAFAGGLLVSPDALREYFFPWLRRIGDLARESSKPLIYHSDGILYDVMEDIIGCGVNALHPIEPKAMEIAEVKQRYGDRLCLVGNVDVDLLSRGTPDQIKEVVRKNIEAVGYNGGYCVGSGNSIPEYVKMENYLAMLDATREFGGG